MSSTETLTRGIYRLPQPCWTVVTASGEPAGFEGSEPHFLTEGEALADLKGFQSEDGPPCRVVRVDATFCCTVAYLHCGVQYVYDDGDIDACVHFADERNLRDCVDHDGLFEVEPGVFACYDDTCRLCGPYQLAGQRGHVADKLTELAELVLRFGTTPRTTYHPDGETLESDTTHTVMLGIMACAIADRFYPHLDLGKIAQRSLTHDLHEVYAGDTNTLFALTEEQKADKKARERAGAFRIHTQFSSLFPWIIRTITEYEALVDPEARFVKAVDKWLPKFTHLLNGGAYLAAAGMTRQQLADRLELQRTVEMAEYASDFPELLELHRVLTVRVLALMDDPR